MTDEIYPGYDPLIDPWPVTCWGHPTAEQMQASADRDREKTAIYRLYGEAYYRDVYELNQWMWRLVFEQAKEEVAEAHPDWARQWPELFR